MQDRLATADILALVKEQALINMRRTTFDEVLFLVCTLLTAVVLLIVINKALLSGALKVTWVTIPSFFVAIYVVLMSLPSALWFYASPRDPIRYTYFLSIQSVLVTFPVGMLLANAIFADPDRPFRIVRQFFTAPLERSVDDRYAFRYWLVMFGVSVAVSGYYLLTSSYVPLIGALTSYGEVEASIVRRSVVAEGNLVHYGHALTARLLLPFCLLYSYFMSDLYCGKWRYVFWLTLGVSAFVSSLTFDRMFPFSIVLYLVLAVYSKYQDRQTPRALALRRRRISKIRLAGYVVGLLAVAMLVGGVLSRAQYNRELSLDIIRMTALDFFVDRVLLDASYMAYIYFEEFNDASKLLYGTSIHPAVSWVFGVEFYPTISPSFVAELWVNFGWVGVLIGSALVGFVLQSVQVRVFDKKTAPALSLYLVMLLNGAWIIYGHLLATMVLSVYIPSILMLLQLKRRRKAAALRVRRGVSPIHDIAPNRG